jgi:hypothetical protein
MYMLNPARVEAMDNQSIKQKPSLLLWKKRDGPIILSTREDRGIWENPK